MKLWSARFNSSNNCSDKKKEEHLKGAVEAFNASIPFDHNLFQDDLIGSAAHAKMLHKIGLLSEAELLALLTGLNNLYQEWGAKGVSWQLEHEDIHTLVEVTLRSQIGPVAGKLHTGRSRNDQVALDMHLFCRRSVVDTIKLLHALIDALTLVAEAHTTTVMPGYTHLQRAQPVTFGHHLLCYAAKFSRDIERYQSIFCRVNRLPLGAGAIAGSTFLLDRRYVAELLLFDEIYENSMDAVSDRDFIAEYIFAANLTMINLSRLSEEMILWCSSEFNFIELSDTFCTGSSMMPQKKNPDVAELVRGKTGRVAGALVGILTVLKGLPLTYNKDMQEDKEGFFDTYKTISTCLALFAPMIQQMKVNAERMRAAAESDFSNATDVADYLVRKGMPFREAYGVVGSLVRYAIEKNKFLSELSLSDFTNHSPLFCNEIFEVLNLDKVVARRESEGGTSPIQVKHQLLLRSKQQELVKNWLDSHEYVCSFPINSLFSVS